MDAKTWITHDLWPLAQDLWESWGIHLLVSASFLMHIILTIFGRRRKYMNNLFLDLIICASYMLSSYIATLAIGKLTTFTIRNHEIPEYSIILTGLLSPLLLMHLSYPDSIIAYSVEDSRQGIRIIINLGVTILFVIWILSRCWKLSFPVSWVYIPLFVSGIIKSAITILALKSIFDDSISARKFDALQLKPDAMENTLKTLKIPSKSSASLDIILKAYCRFNCLRPHLVNWLYHPDLISKNWMSIDSLSPEDKFTVTEFELGFMFDVLYTKAPILYKRLGLIGRLFSLLCLLSTLLGFSIVCRSTFLIDMHMMYTYALLVISTLIELYEIALLPFSEWAIIHMCKRPKKPLVSMLLPFVVSMCVKQKRWSNTVQQVDLLQYCLKVQPPRPLKLVAKLFFQEDKLERSWVSTQEVIPLDVKEVVVNNMERLEMSRRFLPFTNRGQWTLELFEKTLESKRNTLSFDFEVAFDKSIIIWHIATDLLLIEFDREDTVFSRASKLLSNYMMYLLVQRPYVLSLPSAYITLGYASSMLKDFFPKEKGFLEQRQRLRLLEPIQEPDWRRYNNTSITHHWNLLADVQKLAQELREIRDVPPWEVISSVWVEMLCYAAYNCDMYHHAEMLRRGGALITHVWLLLAHKTDKLHTRGKFFVDRLDVGTSNTKKP